MSVVRVIKVMPSLSLKLSFHQQSVVLEQACQSASVANVLISDPVWGTFGSQNPSLEGVILKDLPTELEGKSQAALLVVLC